MIEEAAVLPPAPIVPGSVGILGGTFDPIHHGHLVIAEEAREVLGLERVLLVPTATPPHKPDRVVTAAEHRLAMAELAVAGNPAFSVSGVEVERGGSSYTVETLELLLREGVSDPWFIMSAEALAGLPGVAPARSDPGALPPGGRSPREPRGPRCGLDPRALPGPRGPHQVPPRAPFAHLG